LFISDSKLQKEHIDKTRFAYLLISLFCMLFGAVYEYFSHEVYSGYMIYAFAFPLVGGVLPFTFMSLCGCRRVPGRLTLNLYNAGIAALTVGSIMKGVMEIYGTTNELLQIYWIAGFGFVGIALLLYVIGLLTDRK
jgi:hypothetical protein